MGQQQVGLVKNLQHYSQNLPVSDCCLLTCQIELAAACAHAYADAAVVPAVTVHEVCPRYCPIGILGQSCWGTLHHSATEAAWRPSAACCCVLHEAVAA